MFTRRTLPDTITDRGITFKLDMEATRTKKIPKKTRYRTVTVEPDCSCKVDLHGNPYRRVEWIFIEVKAKDDVLCKI